MSEGTEKLISPNDYRVYDVPVSQAQAYRNAGYAPLQHDLDEGQVRSNFDGWQGAGKSFLLSVMHGIPFATTAYTAATDQAHAAALQDAYQRASDEHPILDFAGRAAGFVGGTAAELAGASALAGAVGLGGAAAAGAAEAGAAGVGAEALGAGVAGEATAAATGAEAAAGAEATGSLAPAARALASNTLGKTVAKGAAINAIAGHIARIDDSALAHAASPEGKEKIQWGLNEDDLIDAAFGAVVPATLGGAAKVLGIVGKQAEKQGYKIMQSALMNAAKEEEVIRQGNLGDIQLKINEVIKEARKNPAEYVKSRILNAGKDMQDLKAKIEYASLGKEDTAQAKEAVLKILGPQNRATPRISEWMQKERWNIQDMQELNEKLYEEIDFKEPTLRPEQDARYNDAAETVKKAMARLFTFHDPTNEQQLAQRWAAAMKDYSEWSRVGHAVKKGAPIDSLGVVMRNVLLKGAAGSTIGQVFGAPFTGAATAAYEGIKSFKPYHFGQVAEKLGTFFQRIDAKTTKAVMAGLYGAPALLHQFHHADNYSDVASKFSAIKQDPLQSFTNIRAAGVQAGLPDDMADDAALAQHTQTQWLASKLPTRATAPDVASNSHGDPVQQRRWLGQYRTMRDPTYAILYPSRSNMEVLQQFYPHLLYNTQQAVLSQMQRNPNLPSAAKAWASRITGRPMNNLSSPAFSSMLQQARAKAAQEQQVQQGAPSRRTKSAGAATSSTRLDELQGASE